VPPPEEYSSDGLEAVDRVEAKCCRGYRRCATGSDRSWEPDAVIRTAGLADITHTDGRFGHGVA
jgi:hypothetical protein